MQRDANNTETVLFLMFFAFVPYLYKAEECGLTCPIAHEVNRCTFWISCNGVIETSILVHDLKLWVQLACGHGNLGWASSAHS